MPWAELADAVEHAGYSVGRAPWFTRTVPRGAPRSIAAAVRRRRRLAAVRRRRGRPRVASRRPRLRRSAARPAPRSHGGRVHLHGAGRRTRARGVGQSRGVGGDLRRRPVASAPGVPDRTRRRVLRARRRARRDRRPVLAAGSAAGGAHRRHRRCHGAARPAAHRPLAADGRLVARAARVVVAVGRRRRVEALLRLARSRSRCRDVHPPVRLHPDRPALRHDHRLAARRRAP